jgi:hypothetical protein
LESREYWKSLAPLSGEEVGRRLGIDGGSARRKIRAAKIEYPELDWFGKTSEPSNKVRMGVAYFDMHHRKHDRRLWRNFLRFVQDSDPDIFVFGGDNMDMEVMSHWVGNKRQVVEGKRLKKDYAAFNAEVLDPLDEILRDDVERVFHLGNHEDWVRQYIQEHPEMEGMIEIEEHLHLDGWQILQYGEVSKFGHLHCTHGTYVNLHNAYKTAQVYGRSIMYGHGHTLQTHTLVTPLDSMPYAATQIPCACELNPSYRLNQPNAWTTGFAVFYVQPDGRFNLYPVVVIDGKFVAPNGVTYE